MDSDKLMESICNFSLDDGPHGNQGYSRVLLHLFDYTDDEKTSFIIPSRYVINDEENFTKNAVTVDASVDNRGDVTMSCHTYEITKKIHVVDNGEFFHKNKFERAEIYAQMGGFIPIDEKVLSNNYIDMMTKLENASLNPNVTDLIVPILIYRREMLLDNIDEKVKEFMKSCVIITGIVPIVVITYRSKGDLIELEKMFKLMGGEVVISIEDNTEEQQGKYYNVLMIIHKALRDVKFRLGQKRNFQENWVKRKKFLLEYIHEADLEKKEGERKIAEEKKRIWEESRKREEEENKKREEENQKRAQEEKQKKVQEENQRRAQEESRREKKEKKHCLIA